MPSAWKRLYLRPDTPTLNPGSTELSAALPVGTFKDLGVLPMSLLPWTGSSQVMIVGTGLAQNTHQDNFFTSFSTPPMLTGTVPAGVWSVGIETQEGNAAANSFFAFSLYVYRPSSTSVVSYIYDSDAPLGNEWGAIQRGRGATFSGASFTAQTGDLLVLELWRHAVQGDSGAYQQQVLLGGDVDVVEGDANTDSASWIEAPQEIGFTPRLRTVTII